MKKAPFLFTLILIFVVNFCCKQKDNSNNVSQLQWTNMHKLPQLHPYFDSLHQSVIIEDTNRINKLYKICKDTLEKLTEDTSVINHTLPYYDTFYKILNAAKIKSSFILEKAVFLLRYNIYINTKKNKSNAVINYYNLLNTKEHAPYWPDHKKIGSMIDVGVAYNKTGDRTKTEETYLATLAVAQKIGDKNRIAQSLSNLNIYLLEKQQYDTIINNSAPYLNEEIKPEYKSKLANSIANAYLAKNNITAALQYTKKSEQFLLSIDSGEMPEDYDNRMGVVFTTYSNIYEAQKDWPKTDLYYSKALQQYSQANNNTGREMGKLHLQIARYQQINPNAIIEGTPLMHINQAIYCIDTTFNIADSLAWPKEVAITDENLFFETMDAKAKYCLGHTSLANTIEGLAIIDNYYKSAFVAEKKLLNNFVYDNSKIEFLEYSKQRTALAVANCYKAYKLSNNTIWQEKAFAYIENSKATVLLEQLKKNKILQSTLAADPLVKQLDSLKKELINDDINPIAVKTQKEEVEQLLKNKYPQLNDQNQFENNITLNKIRENLNKRTLLLNYFYVQDTLYYIYVSKKEVRFSKQSVSQSILEKYKVDCANVELQQQSPDVFFNGSFSLTDALGLAQIEEKIDELIIMPSDALHNLSFESLLLKRFHTVQQLDFLVNRYCINYCYSYGTLLQKNDYKNTNSNVLICTPASENKIDNQPMLSFSKNEAAEIKREFRNALHLNNNEATASAFLQQYNKHKIIHLATHSTSDSVSGNSKIDFFDAPIQAQQLQQNNTLKTDLFFLSACETSLGKQTQNEGVLSLARSLYYAGAQNVIAAQWSINDATTSQIVAQFYKEIKTKKYAKALQLSKIAYLKQNSADKKLPFYWASLTHIGYQTYYKTHNYYWLALIGCILFLATAVFLLKTRFKNSVKLRNMGFFKKNS